MTVDLRHGNCLDILPTLPDCSVDSIVTDPPYELGFMGKRWDNSGIAYNVTLWQECLRVLKPGGHLLAFGGTRTYHRMACAIEDAGFEIRDSIHWLYGSGFPKSLDVSKAIDKVNGEPNRLFKFTAWMRTTGLTARQLDEITETKMGNHYTTHSTQPAIPTAAMWEVIRPHCGDVPEWVDELVARIEAEREIIGKSDSTLLAVAPGEGRDRPQITLDITAPATDAAKQWAGWGTALKPAHEPIVVARKPLIGTVAANVLEYGTGAINIDASRIAGAPWTPVAPNAGGRSGGVMGKHTEHPGGEPHQAGRWPANVILTHTEDCQQVGVRDDTYQINRLEEWSGFGQKKQPDYDGSGRSVSVPVWDCVPGCPVALLDEQSGLSKSSKSSRGERHGNIYGNGQGPTGPDTVRGHADSGGASRFFYCAKPSRRERNAGLNNAPLIRESDRVADDKVGGDNTRNRSNNAKQNHHPTVKPLALMRYLVRLVTPPGGTVLEPFAGSGTTLMACVLEGFDAIGIEMTDEYLPIIQGRIAWAEEEASKESPQQELEL